MVFLSLQALIENLSDQRPALDDLQAKANAVSSCLDNPTIPQQTDQIAYTYHDLAMQLQVRSPNNACIKINEIVCHYDEYYEFMISEL